MKKTVHHAAAFGRVAVLMGGRSAEREISLQSGQAVLTALVEQGIDAHRIDVNKQVSQDLLDGGFERAFVMLHGRGGEDGEIQGLLQALGLPYTGSDITGAVLSINKRISKQIWQQMGLPTAQFEVLNQTRESQRVLDELGLPLMVKPVNEGSSIGMTKVTSQDQLEAAIEQASQFDSEVIAEQWIDGEEYTVAIVQHETLPVIRLNTPHDFYDYDAKYQADTTEYHCPSGLDQQEEAKVQVLALQAFDALHMSGWGRIDLMRDKTGQYYLLEANSIPGMTDHSLVPMAARQAGISFEQLVWHILESSMDLK